VDWEVHQVGKMSWVGSTGKLFGGKRFGNPKFAEVLNVGDRYELRKGYSSMLHKHLLLFRSKQFEFSEHIFDKKYVASDRSEKL